MPLWLQDTTPAPAAWVADMTEFRMCVAGATAAVSALFECTPAFFRPYLTDSQPDFSAVVTREDIAFEGAALYEEALQEGFCVRKFTDPFLERAAIQRKFAEFLFDRDTILLHGSTVAVDGTAYLFTAKCGTGKSTHTRLWCQAFGDRAVMVNDDKPFIAVTKNGAFACGSPWSGKHGLDTNISAALKGICLLERGTENRIERAEKEALLPMLLAQSCRPLESGKEQQFFQLVNTLAETVPLWQMQCTRDIEAAHMAYAVMSQANK